MERFSSNAQCKIFNHIFYFWRVLLKRIVICTFKVYAYMMYIYNYDKYDITIYKYVYAYIYVYIINRQTDKTDRQAEIDR